MGEEIVLVCCSLFCEELEELSVAVCLERSNEDFIKTNQNPSRVCQMIRKVEMLMVQALAT